MDISIHRCADSARMDGKDLNSIFSGFLRQGLAKANESRLTHYIGGERRYGLHAGDTRHVDDPSTAACAPTWEHGVGIEKGDSEIDFDFVPPSELVDCSDRPKGTKLPRIVNQQ